MHPDSKHTLSSCNWRYSISGCSLFGLNVIDSPVLSSIIRKVGVASQDWNPKPLAITSAHGLMSLPCVTPTAVQGVVAMLQDYIQLSQERTRPHTTTSWRKLCYHKTKPSAIDTVEHSLDKHVVIGSCSQTNTVNTHIIKRCVCVFECLLCLG